MVWLVFGDILGFYSPKVALKSQAEDFFFASAIILVTSNAVYLLVKNIHQSLARAQAEIEEREKAEKEREELIKQLKLKNQELDRFAIAVSHDLKTPLITIAGYLGYLEKDMLAGNKERVSKNIGQINDAAKSMGKLVDEILDLSRIGRIHNPPRAVSFEEVVQEALKAAEGLLKAKQVKVKGGKRFSHHLLRLCANRAGSPEFNNECGQIHGKANRSADRDQRRRKEWRVCVFCSG